MAKKIIKIDADKERHLKLGVNGLIEIEKILEAPLTQLSENIGISEFRVILYVALKWEDKELTLSKVGDIMDDLIEAHGFETLGKMVGDLVSSAMGALPSK